MFSVWAGPGDPLFMNTEPQARWEATSKIRLQRDGGLPHLSLSLPKESQRHLCKEAHVARTRRLPADTAGRLQADSAAKPGDDRSPGQHLLLLFLY